MKSTLIKNRFEEGDWKFDRYFIECDCLMPNHLLVIDIEDDNKYIDVSILSDWRSVWYKRIWYAIKYIFQCETFPYSNSVGIYIDNIDDFYEAITAVREHFKKFKEK